MSPSINPEFLAAFRACAGTREAVTFAEFMRMALYEPNLGYYRKSRPRVGYAPGTDFFTASTSGAIFGELVAAACVSLLGPDRCSDTTFVELGAENGASVLEGVAHPFRAVRTIGAGDPIVLSGRCAVFSNELFDAQPFRRFVRRDGAWRELGVALVKDELREIEMDPGPTPVELSEAVPDGYVLDAPLAAAELARMIATQRWTGVFVACDYGKSWAELRDHCLIGTARAYFRHAQSNDLLAHPTEQDLTCHVCWDWLEAALREHGCREIAVESQESFFIRRATRVIEDVSTREAGRFSQKKLSLLQLLHPSSLGQKFQVLHARRD